jgi:hypothetical protein
MKLIINETRTSKDVNFFQWDESIHLYVEEMYIKTGKILSLESKYSVSELTRTFTIEYKSMQDCIDFKEDGYLTQARFEKLDHDRANNITVEVI